MKNLTINGKDFLLADSSFTFLKSYLERTKRYIESNSLESSLYDDIEERIAERLSDIIDSGSEIQERDVIDIVNNTGEPEDIFKDEEKKEKTKSTSNNLPRKNSKEGMIFGVCQGLGEYFGINPLFIRLIFILSLFFFGTGIFIYILLAIVLPDKNETKANLKKNIKNAAERLNELTTSQEVKDAGNNIGNSFRNLIMAIVRLISFFFFIFVSIFLFMVSLGSVIFGGMVRSGLVIDNQSLFAHVPSYIFPVFILIGITTLILSIGSFMLAIRRPFINVYFLITLIVLLGISGFGISSGFFETASFYTDSFSKTEDFTISGSIAGGNIVSLRLDEMLDSVKRPLESNTAIYFDKSQDADIHIKIKDSVRAKNESDGNYLLSQMNPITSLSSTGQINLSLSGTSDFKQTVPFAFMMRDITIMVPSGLKINLSDNKSYNYYLRNVDFENDDRNGYPYDCNRGIISYDQTNFRFRCEAE